ncbi:MAG: DUF192 domain-containing protein [Planctomycetota bacterium]
MRKGWQLCERTTSKVIVPDLWLAVSFWARFVGLQFRRSLPEGAGLLLAPCNSVHTCFCFFPMDVVFLSREGVVLEIRRALRPWRFVSPVKQARYVLETAAGELSLAVGDQLALAGPKSESKPKRLQDFPSCDRQETP